MSRANRPAAAACLFLITLLGASSLTCDFVADEAKPVFEAVQPLLDPQKGIPIDEAEIRAHIAETAFALSLTQTAIAELQAAEPAQPVAPPPAPAPGPHIPTIDDVDFPALWHVSAGYASGTIFVTDAAQDVNYVNIETVEGHMGSGGWNTDPDLHWSGGNGRIPFQASCGRPETVRAVLTLRDAAGNVSDGYTFAFICQ